MTVDLATLAIKIDTTDTKAAVDQLHNLTDAGAKAEKATDGLGASHRRASSETKTATQAADELTQRYLTLTGAVGVLGTALTALGISKLADAAIDANREMQSLQASMKIATGSVEAAAAQMDKLKKFATETPYGLEQSVNAFLKLKNLGLDPSIEAMRSYGNTSASMGKDLMQMIEAVADASTGEFERLKEFGIKASQEKGKVSLTFQGVTTTIKNNSEEIQKYLRAIGDTQFAGSMDAQMQTLNGQFANLEDAVAAAFVAFGEGGFNDALSEAVSAMSGAAEGATSTAAQLGAMAGEAIRTATAITKALAPAFRFLVDNIGTIVDIAQAATVAFIAMRVAMAAVEALKFAQAMIAVQTGVFGATTAQAACTVATYGLATAVRGLISAALGPLGIALAAATIAYGYLSNAEVRVTEATGDYVIRLNQANQMVEIAERMRGRLAFASEAARKAFINETAAIYAQTIELGKNAVAAMNAARAKIADAEATARQTAARAIATRASGPLGSAANWLFGNDQAAQKAADALAAYRGEVKSSEAAVLTYDKAAQQMIKNFRDAGSYVIPKAAGAMGKAGDAAKKVKEQVDPLVKTLANLEKAVNAAERELEKMFTREEPKEGPLDFIARGAQFADDLIAKLDQLSDEKYRLRVFDNDQTREATREMINNLDAIANRAAIVGDVMRDAFGGLGDIFGGALADMADYQQRQADLAAQVKAGTKTRIEMEQELTAIQARNTASLIGGVKSLFKEKSVAYKAMDVIEKAHAALQLANMVKSIAMDTAQTTASVANSMTRGSADAAAGAAKIFSFLGPFGFPVVAAMVAVLAAMGLKGLSGGSSGGGYTPPSAEEMQKTQSTGTVLGSPGEKSESIANSLTLMLANTNKDLEYSNEAVRHLRAIDNGITQLTALLARQLGATSGMFDTSGLGLGSTASGSGIIGALFGSKTTRSLFDQGLQVLQTTVNDVLTAGINAQVYSVVEEVKKKKFLGLTVGGGKTYETTTGAVSGDIEKQFGLIVQDIADSIIAFGKQAGVDLTEYIKAVNIPTTKLSLAGLNAEEIQQAIQDYFSAIADMMVRQGFGIAETSMGDMMRGFHLEDFQRAGEGLFETLARVTKEMTSVAVALRSINMEPIAASIGGTMFTTAGATTDLVDRFGGLDQLMESVSQFRDAFLTEAEQMAPIISSVRAEMERLGQTGITTNDQFKSLVLGLDLSTDAGREMFASLLAVAPAFAKVTEYLGSLDAELGQTGKTAAELAQIAKQSRALDIALMEALGDAAGALAAKRADELAALDESLRAKQLEVWAAQDAAAAARDLAAANEAATRAAQLLAETRRSLEIRIMEMEGDAVGALAARRADELAKLDESLRPLQLRIYALEDAKTAEEAAAAAAAALADAEAKAAEERLRIADQRATMEIELMRLVGNEAGALAAKRERELAALPEVLRALQLQIYLQQDLNAARDAEAKAAEEAAARVKAVADERYGLELRLLEATGRGAEALAMRRQAELAAMDESNRAFAEMVYAAEDAAQAIGGVKSALDLAKQAADLNIRLLEAQGNSAAALAARRAQEIAATDESLHAMLRAIYAAEDLATAQAAQAEAARAAKQASEEAARAAQALADQRAGMEITLLRALGRETEAVALTRQRELAALDPTLQALQKQIYAAQDAAAAQAALAQAQAEAAAKAEQLAKDRLGLQIRILDLEGNSLAATALKRQQELAALDESLRPLQLMIYALEDAQAAEEARTSAISTARNTLSAAYERESKALTDTIDRFKGFADSLREFRATLTLGGEGLGDVYRRAQAAFVDTASAARMGDAKALGSLTDVSKTFLLASRNQAATLLDYQRDVSRVMRATDAAIGAADGAVDIAQAELDTLNAIAASVGILPEAVMTFAEALAAFNAALADQPSLSTPQPVEIVPPTTAPNAPIVLSDPAAQSELAALRKEVADLHAAMIATATNTGSMKRIFERADGGDFIKIGNDSDTPVTAKIVNGEDEPVKVDQV